MSLPRPNRAFRILFALSIVLAATYYGIFIFRTSFLVDGERYFCLQDDAMISMRYAKNLTSGFGLVWNPGGERVEGFTNPLWVLFMAGLHLLPIPASKISLLVQVSAAAFLLTNLAFVARMSRQADSSATVSLLAVILTAFYLPLVNWALQGMEVSVLALLTSGSVLLALRALRTGRVSLLLYGVMALGTLIRPDMVVPYIAISAFLIIADRSNRWRHACLAALILTTSLVLQTGFRIAYFGDPLPNTYYLKLSGYPLTLRLSRGLYVFSKFAVQMGFLFFLLPILSVLVRRDRVGRLLISVFASLACYSIYAGGDAWEEWGGSNRYVSVAMPCFFVLLARSLADVSRLIGTAAKMSRALAATLWVPPRSERFAYLTLALSALLSLNSTRGGDALGEWALRLRPIQTDVNQKNVELAIALMDLSRPNAKIAVMMAGVVPYFLDRYAIDLLGKSDAHVAHLPMHRFHGLRSLIFFTPGHLKWDFEWSINRFRPDIVLHVAGTDEARRILEARYSEAVVRGESVFVLLDSESISWSLLEDTSHGVEKVQRPLTLLR
jgi:arabinofuranosyltransferase